MSINKFFIIVAVTIILSRLWLWFFPKHGPVIGELQLHHYMYGLVLILIYLIISKPAILAVGTGFVIDEIPLLFIFQGANWPDNHWKQYFSWESTIWIIVILLVSYFLASTFLQKI